MTGYPKLAPQARSLRLPPSRVPHPLFLVAILLPLTALAQPSYLTFLSTLDFTEQPYALFLPDNYNPAQPYPLLVSLHTEDSNHRLNLRQVLGPPNRLGWPT